MIIDKPETEALAAMQVVSAIVTTLRRKGLLSGVEAEGMLKTAAFAMHNSDDERVRAAARLVDEVRVKALRD